MVDPTPSDYHLTYLRERWDRDRSSRIFLQLAEEYRRRGLHSEALEVLETGLGFHPGYLAAQVALGRCRLEAGEAETAVKVLERVLTQDPTQAVATRLLAESWLQLGDEDRAQQAVDRCRLIGIPPAELVGLEQRMAAARRAARERWAEAMEPVAAPVSLQALAEPAAEVPQPWRAEAERAPVAEELSLEPTAITRLLPAPEPAPTASPVARAAVPVPGAPAAGGHEVFRLPAAPQRTLMLPLRPGAERRLTGSRNDEPFGRVARQRPRPAPQAEIFHLVPAWEERPAVPAQRAAPPASTAPSVPAMGARGPAPGVGPAAAAPPAAASEGALAAIPAPQPSAPTRWWDRPAESSQPEPRTPELPLPPPTSTRTAEPAGEPAALREEPKPRPAPTAAPPARSALAGTAGVELRQSGSLDVPELRPSDPGTATLGELYLRQGYVREAEEIFKQVLARDADNEAALSGLEAIGRRRAQKLTAAELLAAPEEQGEKEVRGLTARKIQLLTRYLRTLRRGAGSDVPGTAH